MPSPRFSASRGGCHHDVSLEGSISRSWLFASELQIEANSTTGTSLRTLVS